ncbi:MAG: chemotaxis protein CheW [Burkholderiales bacterium]|nr:chemotaxis protein CheW [Burkholderiales bacterium]MCW5604550.1 chemotaxis protein CheW [Burkholderiales bacterium]
MSKALRLDAGGDVAAAIGLHEIIEVAAGGDIEPVPLAPDHCRELLCWRTEWIPVFDLAVWRHGPAAASGAFLAIVGYRDRDGGARARPACIRVAAFPRIVEVSDADACPLPEGGWSRIAKSCFSDGGQRVPVLSLRRVFAMPHPRTGDGNRVLRQDDAATTAGPR